jgi:hypothetical protein
MRRGMARATRWTDWSPTWGVQSLTRSLSVRSGDEMLLYACSGDLKELCQVSSELGCEHGYLLMTSLCCRWYCNPPQVGHIRGQHIHWWPVRRCLIQHWHASERGVRHRCIWKTCWDVDGGWEGTEERKLLRIRLLSSVLFTIRPRVPKHTYSIG